VNQLIEFIRNFTNWILRIYKWLIYEFKLFGITVVPFIIGYMLIKLVPIGVLEISFFKDTLESRFREGGLFLELLGIGTVVFGINNSLNLFESTHFLGIIFGKLKRFPKFKLSHHTLSASLCASTVSFSGTLSVRVNPPSNANIEDRVIYLEEEMKRTLSQIQEHKTFFEKELKSLSNALNAERSKRESENKQIQKSLKEFAVGDVYIELMGIVWLITGAISATASPELASLFG
jgi:hypothetical protein